MLTVAYELLDPQYVPIAVNATLHVRGNEHPAEQEITAILAKALDTVNGPRDFGQWIRFNEIYQLLLDLPFVDAFDSLSF